MNLLNKRGMYEGYYKIVGNPFVNFVKDCIEYIFGLVILFGLFFLIWKAIWMLINFFSLIAGDFIGDYKDEKVEEYKNNKVSKRYNRKSNVKIEEGEVVQKKEKRKKQKIGKKPQVSKEYEGLTPEEILEKMNKKF